MTTFKYAAKGPGGKTVEGTITAADRNEVAAELRKQNLVATKIEESTSGPKKNTGPTGLLGMVKKPSASRTDLVMFTRQLATMVGSGLALDLASELVRGRGAHHFGHRLDAAEALADLRGEVTEEDERLDEPERDERRHVERELARDAALLELAHVLARRIVERQ